MKKTMKKKKEKEGGRDFAQFGEHDTPM